MLNFTVSADFTEVDKTMGLLMRGLKPEYINNLAAKVARKQVKTKYEERFASQVKQNSLWQQTKREVSYGLPLGADPGFLTGTTFNSIISESSDEAGRVYPMGGWPQGSGSAWSQSLTAEEYGQSQYKEGAVANTRDTGIGFEWDSTRLHAHPIGSFPMDFEGHPSMIHMRYGNWSKISGIDWLYLDGDDVNQIDTNLNRYFDALVRRDYDAIARVFADATYRDEEKFSDKTADDLNAATAAVVGSTQEIIEAHFGMSLADVMAKYGVASEKALIRKFESMLETQQIKEVFWEKR